MSKKRFKDYQDYLNSPEWEKLREKAHKRVIRDFGSDQCEICGMFLGLCVHHINYPKDWSKDNQKNHVVLCDYCHKKEHENGTHNNQYLSRSDYLRIRHTSHNSEE